jgi:hypothetical protein
MTGDDGSGDGNAREPGRWTADFGGLRLAILNTERTIADLGGPLCPTCKTSTAGSNPALASSFSSTLDPVVGEWSYLPEAAGFRKAVTNGMTRSTSLNVPK